VIIAFDGVIQLITLFSKTLHYHTLFLPEQNSQPHISNLIMPGIVAIAYHPQGGHMSGFPGQSPGYQTNLYFQKV
jgi:hypothetical protein